MAQAQACHPCATAPVATKGVKSCCRQRVLRTNYNFVLFWDPVDTKLEWQKTAAGMTSGAGHDDGDERRSTVVYAANGRSLSVRATDHRSCVLSFV
jgi:hypothetical protein